MLQKLAQGQVYGAAQGQIGSMENWWGQNAGAYQNYVQPTYTLGTTSTNAISYNAGALKG